MRFIKGGQPQSRRSSSAMGDQGLGLTWGDPPLELGSNPAKDSWTSAMPFDYGTCPRHSCTGNIKPEYHRPGKLR